MSFDIFDTIRTTNAAYLDSLGLPSDVYTRPLAVAEVYGTELSEDEMKVAQTQEMK